ncbi:hypothetical protein J6590_066995 [Homalodisca vitripennis]|nr:hypothetical protein J6590_066995 [Homalodisca vitripennis]
MCFFIVRFCKLGNSFCFVNKLIQCILVVNCVTNILTEIIDYALILHNIVNIRVYARARLERHCLNPRPALERDSSTALPIDIRSCSSDIRVPSAALESQL